MTQSVQKKENLNHGKKVSYPSFSLNTVCHTKFNSDNFYLKKQKLIKVAIPYLLIATIFGRWRWAVV